MVDNIGELLKPKWLDSIMWCPFCGGCCDVDFDPLNPYAVSWRCRECKACGVTSPPIEEVVVESVEL